MSKKLVEIKVDKKKVMLYVAMRMLLFAICVFGCFVAGKETTNPNYIDAFMILAVILMYACSPLRHLKDTLTYYDNKIVFNKKELTFTQPKEIRWMRQMTYITGTRVIMMKTSDKKGVKEIFFPSSQIDVTYMYKPKETFIKYYMKTV